jgi:hypothetical protein
MKNLFTLLVLVSCIQVIGQSRNSELLRLRSGDYSLGDPIANNSELVFFNGRTQLIVQFDEWPDTELREALSTSGLKLPYYLDGKSFLGVVNSSFVNNIPQGIRLYPFQPEMKLSEELLQGELPIHATSGKRIMVMCIHLGQFNHADIREDLESHGYHILEDHSNQGSFSLMIDWNELEDVLELPTTGSTI